MLIKVIIAIGAIPCGLAVYYIGLLCFVAWYHRKKKLSKKYYINTRQPG